MTVQDLIKTYDIYLEKNWDTREKKFKPTGRIGVNAAGAKKSGVLDEIKARKQEIIDFLNAKESAKKAAFEDRQNRIRSIEGLSEINSARNALFAWNRAFDKAMNAEYGDSLSMLGPKPQYDFESAYEKYPKASAYLKAESLANKSNYELSAIGRKAVEEILYGDWEKAIETMNAERSAFADRHAWD